MSKMLTPFIRQEFPPRLAPYVPLPAIGSEIMRDLIQSYQEDCAGSISRFEVEADVGGSIEVVMGYGGIVA